MYQVLLAAHIKKAIQRVLVGAAIGRITGGKEAERYLQEGVNVIMIARELLRRRKFSVEAAQELGVVVESGSQCEYGWSPVLKHGDIEVLVARTMAVM